MVLFGKRMMLCVSCMLAEVMVSGEVVVCSRQRGESCVLAFDVSNYTVRITPPPPTCAWSIGSIAGPPGHALATVRLLHLFAILLLATEHETSVSVIGKAQM